MWAQTVGQRIFRQLNLSIVEQRPFFRMSAFTGVHWQQVSRREDRTEYQKLYLPCAACRRDGYDPPPGHVFTWSAGEQVLPMCCRGQDPFVWEVVLLAVLEADGLSEVLAAKRRMAVLNWLYGLPEPELLARWQAARALAALSSTPLADVIDWYRRTYNARLNVHRRKLRA